ncbi:MAG: hypothetical protein KAW88_09645 [Candidatus Cloacimonetes bacterium]|nr:hypothetical protein [Candidatus Cloacimonadota bacterium]
MKKLILFLTCMLLLSFSTLLAMPYTCLGNVNIPDAYVLPHKMVDFSYTNYFVNDGIVPGDTVMYNEYDFAGAIRVGLFDRAEIELVYTSTAGVFCNLKGRIISETETLPALSIGIANLFSSVDDFKSGDSLDYEFPDRVDYIKNSFYIVISKSLVIITGMPIMDYLETSFHGGMGMRKFQGKGEIVKSFGGVFLGMDVKPSRYWGFDFEWDSQNINFGLNGFYKNFTLRAGIYEIESLIGINEKGQKIAINLRYTLDKFSELKAADKRIKTVAPRTIPRTKPGVEEYDEESNPLMEELEQIRKRRKQAEKELEEIRKLLQE